MHESEISEIKFVHPLKRVRSALKETSEMSGLRKHASSKGFAEWIGRSPSLIRNVECGITAKWDRLAKLIESKTRVSSEWLQSSPAPTEPILDVDGRVWDAAEALDPYQGGKCGPNVAKLLLTSPKSVPRVIAKMVEAQINLGLSEGRMDFLSRVLTLFREFDSFRSEEFRNAIADALKAETACITTEIWPHMGCMKGKGTPNWASNWTPNWPPNFTITESSEVEVLPEKSKRSHVSLQSSEALKVSAQTGRDVSLGSNVVASRCRDGTVT